MKYLFLLLQIFVLSTSLAAVEDGQRIYLEGLDDQRLAIKSYINDLEAGSALACANCHRESGLGTSESGKTIPPVSWTFLGVNQPVDDKSIFYSIQNKRKAYDTKLLHRLLTTGIDSDGQIADTLMPRYVISEKQTESLEQYLKTLFVGNDPGVDADVIRIATILDPRLPQQQKDRHKKFMQGLFDMKNSLTRGELRRKKYSPIQKAPQYESYRHWELVIWELPENPDLWAETLKSLYIENPVFVVLSPVLKDSYSGVGEFCNEMKLPCLFSNGLDSGSGDYYNFVYRNSEKQQKDYLNKKIREEKDRLYYLDSDGRLKKIVTSKMQFPEISKSSESFLLRQFNDFCADEITVLIRAELDVIQPFYDFNCTNKQKAKLKIIIKETTAFQDVADFIKTNNNSAICLVTDYGKMLKRNSRKIRTDVLTRKFKMDNNESELLARDLYSYGLLTDSLHQLAGNFSRAYLMEIIEHMLNSFPNYTYFNSVTGAPGQRAIVGPVTEYCPSVGKV